MTADFPTGVVTLVFTDIEESAVLWEQHGAAFQRVQDEHRRLVREAAGRWGGAELGTEGDSFFLVFPTASGAVRFAVDAQRALGDCAWPALAPGIGELRVRIGMHTGEPLLRPGAGGAPEYSGPVVNRAARVAAAAHGGQVLLSEATRLLAAPELPAELAFRDLGVHRLKGVGEERLWQACHPDLPREFPPPQTLASGRHNLPLPSTPFVGRETELAQWRAILLRPGMRLLTLIGSGGVGKTRAALQLAELCADDFADGVRWVPLEETRTGDEMLQQIASHLGLALQPQASIREQVGSFFRDRKLLLVLDNTEQLPEAAGQIHALLSAAPNLRCLVTTRRALELGAEQLVEVAPLPESDAERLFVERARARRADFTLTAENAADITQLCRRLEGVPLAIELAAPRIAAMSPREIHSRLAERFRLLQTRAPDLPPRQRALKGTIDWSYDLLGEEDRFLLAQLAVFAGGFAMAHAEAVCQAFDVLEGVMELRRHSLLQTEMEAATQETRFRMLESVREYALAILESFPEGGSDTRLRHAEQFRQFAAEQIARVRTPEEVTALQRLGADGENVRAAMDWALQDGRDALGAELALALGRFLEQRGFQAEATRRVEAGLEAARRLPGEGGALYASLLRERAGLHIDQFEWTDARRCVNEALVLGERLPDPVGQAEATNLLGIIAKGEHDFATARSCFREALNQFERINDPVGIAKVQNNLGLVEYDDPAGDREQAARYLEEVLQLHRRRGDKRGIAEASTNLGALAQEQGGLADARRYYEEALCCERELGHAFGVGRALSNLGEIAELQGELEGACRLFAAAEVLFGEVGSRYQSYTLDLLSRVAAARGTPPEALDAQRARLKGQALDALTDWALDEGLSAQAGTETLPHPRV